LPDRRLGVLERRVEREERREVERLDFLERERLEAEREERREVDRSLAARRLEPFGVRDLRELLIFDEERLVVDRVELRRDEALEDDFLGAFGVLERRAERRLEDFDVVRRLVPLGALALRRAALRRLSEVWGRLLGALGVLARRAERRREDFREDERFAFFAFFPSSSWFQARFFLGLIPISMFLIATMQVLYSSFSLTCFQCSLVFWYFANCLSYFNLAARAFSFQGLRCASLKAFHHKLCSFITSGEVISGFSLTI